MTKRIRLLGLGQVEFLTSVILAALVTAGCAVALFNLTYQVQTPTPSLPLIQGGKDGGTDADVGQDGILPHLLWEWLSADR